MEQFTTMGIASFVSPLVDFPFPRSLGPIVARSFPFTIFPPLLTCGRRRPDDTENTPPLEHRPSTAFSATPSILLWPPSTPPAPSPPTNHEKLSRHLFIKDLDYKLTDNNTATVFDSQLILLQPRQPILLGKLIDLPSLLFPLILREHSFPPPHHHLPLIPAPSSTAFSSLLLLLSSSILTASSRCGLLRRIFLLKMTWSRGTRDVGGDWSSVSVSISLKSIVASVEAEGGKEDAAAAE